MEQNFPKELADYFHLATLDSSQIPELELYMDQVISLTEQSLQGGLRNEEEKLLTKAMINNYSKEGLLSPIRGKKYSKEHVLIILMIYHLKKVTALPDIRLFLDAQCQLWDEQNDSYQAANVRELYDYFTAAQLRQQAELATYVQTGLSALGDSPSLDERARAFLELSAIAQAASSAAEALLDRLPEAD